MRARVTLHEARVESRLRNSLCGGKGAIKKKHKETEIVVQAPRKRFEYKGETKEPRVSTAKRLSFKVMPRLLYRFLFGFVLNFFKTLNRRIGSNLALWFMKCETLQHVDLMIRVFKWVVLPASLLYVCSDFCFFRQNALDSMFLGILIFVYSNFLPDLPSIYRRRKIYRNVGATTEDLPWYKKYALLLFAPLFIGAFIAGIRLRWETTETFHNFKSLMIYGVFLFILSVFVFGDYPISIGDITEILSLPFYGLVGYVTHLKVDLCF